MTDRLPGAPGQYSAIITAAELQKLQAGEAFSITLTRDDHPITEGTPYSKATVLPDDLAAILCPEIQDPTPADALRGLHSRMTGIISPTGIELVPQNGANHGGFVDFHYDGSTEDYTARIWESAKGNLQFLGNLDFSVCTVSGLIASHIGATPGEISQFLPKNGMALSELPQGFFAYSVTPDLMLDIGFPSGLTTAYGTVFGVSGVEYPVIHFQNVFGEHAIWSTHENRWVKQLSERNFSYANGTLNITI